MSLNHISWMRSPSSQCRTPRRVLQVITPSRMSGAEMQLVRMTTHMQKRGHTFATVVKRNSPAVPEMTRFGLNPQALRISGKANVAALPLIRHAACEFHADIVQSTLSTASWWAGWLEKMGGPPSIGHVQGFTSAAWHRQQSHLIAVSHAVKRHLVNQGIAPEKFTVLHNAISPDDFYATRDPVLVRAELGAEPNTPVVGTFAHLSPKKGYRELFDAMPAVLRQLPNAQFWIVGEGRLWAELHKTAEQSGVMSNVRFLGYRRDVADLMGAIDVMALPSHCEPCALAYVEAALSSKPSIGCRAGGAPESIAENETGLLVPVGDAQAIANAMLTLLTNRTYARRMGRAGYDRAVGLFSWDRFIHTLEHVYDRVLDEAPAERRVALRAAA